MKENRIIVVSAYGGHNLGDDAIVNITLEHLRKTYKDIDVIGFCDGHGMYFCDDYTTECSNKYFLYDENLRNIYLFIKKMFMFLFGKKYNKMIFVGGGYFNGYFLSKKALIMLKIVSLKAEKIYFTGQSIGAFSGKIGKYVSKSLLSKAECVGVREQESNDIAEKMEICVKLTGDDVFLKEYKSNCTKNNEDYIVVNIKCYPDMDKYNITYKEILLKSLKQLNKKVILLPFNDVLNSKEYELHLQFCEELEREGVQSSIKVPKTIEELCELLANSKLNIGNAYHFVAFSILVKSNFITWYKGDYYSQKVGGIINLFHIEDSLLDIDEPEKSHHQIIDKYEKKVNYDTSDVNSKVKQLWNIVME